MLKIKMDLHSLLGAANYIYKKKDKVEAFVGISQLIQALYHNLMQRESAKLSYGN